MCKTIDLQRLLTVRTAGSSDGGATTQAVGVAAESRNLQTGAARWNGLLFLSISRHQG